MSTKIVHDELRNNNGARIDESVKGMGLGHVLWCYNMIHAYGMFETANQRYSNLEKFNQWDNKKTFEDNIKAM